MRLARTEGWPALVLLARLKLVARLRRLRQDLSRPGRVLVMVLLAILGVAWLFAASPRRGEGFAMQEPLVAAIALFFLVSTVWGTARNGALSYSPEEVHFLFPGPVGTRALLLAYVGTSLLRAASGSLFFALFLRTPEISPLRLWAGYSAFLFAVGLLAAVVDLRLLQLSPERRRAAGARLAAAMLGTIALAAGVAYAQDGELGMATLRHASLPLRPFLDLLFAAGAGRVLLGGALSLLIIGALLGRLLAFRGDLREAAHEKSERTERRLARAREGVAFAEAPREHVKRTLPMLPGLRGAGPHAWRQLVSLLRARRPIVMTLFLAGWMGLATGGARDPERLAAAMLGMLAFAGPMYLQCDFRSDYANLAWLRSMPSTAGALAFGQMLGSTLVISALGLLVSGWVLAVAPPAHRALWVLAFMALPAVVLLQLCIENGAFLLYPLRLVRTQRTGAGLGMLLRFYALLLLKLAALAVALAGPGALGAGLAHLSGSRLVGGGAALAALAGVTAGAVWLVGQLFLRADPSREAL